MKEVQEYLKSGKTLEDLTNEFGIKVYYHPTLPLVGMKYHQLDSPKTHPVVRACRGTVLEKDTWEFVAVPFRRFFNLGEDLDNFKDFNWNDFTCMEKVDGSIIIVYHYQGQWHVNTSGSFGLLECEGSGKTWGELFWEASKIDVSKLDSEYTYVFEMWTPFNVVVRSYPESTAYLLSVFHVETLNEVSVVEADEFAKTIGVDRPEHHVFTSVDEILSYIKEKEQTDMTYEGFVIRDNKNQRYKIKSDTYRALHRIRGESGNEYSPKNLVPLILSGNSDKVINALKDRPEIKIRIEKIEETLDREIDNLVSLWKANWQIESQKDFALAVVGKTKFSTLLFQIRKELGKNQTEQDLRNKWRMSEDMIIRQLYS